ncbi:hypothetical protein MKW94_004524 [Papaver nudicaule]|uniref:Protein TIFY n=1 Tax=Papaver nudicaule TaxID=74823 RepID=A0AA41V4U4_PAPNU|nr:hypothetical protein [Papaver nudicaule]
MSSFAAENSGRKPKFTRTCSMLSQYLKQNGSFGDLSRGMTCTTLLDDQKDKTPITMNLLPMDDFSAKAPPAVKPMDLFPKDTGFVRSLSMKEPATVETVRSVPAEVAEEETPLTIFYAGKVVVFDKLPKDKAKEIMDYADVISSTNPITPPQAKNDQLIVNSSGGVDLNSAPILASNVPDAVPAGIGSPVKDSLVSGEEKMCKQNHVPIARKASLHRFLEKRKDRIIAKAPYEVVNNSSASTEVSTKPAEPKKSWLNLASSMPPPPPRLQLQL